MCCPGLRNVVWEGATNHPTVSLAARAMLLTYSNHPVGCCAWGGQGQKAPGRHRPLQDVKSWSSSHWNLALTCSEPL